MFQPAPLAVARRQKRAVPVESKDRRLQVQLFEQPLGRGLEIVRTVDRSAGGPRGLGAIQLQRGGSGIF